MKLSIEQIEEVADFLRGTCLYSYEDALEEVLGVRPDFYGDVMDKDDCQELDQLVFNCNCCGWWCDTSELSPVKYEEICDQCYEENEEYTEE